MTRALLRLSLSSNRGTKVFEAIRLVTEEAKSRVYLFSDGLFINKHLFENKSGSDGLFISKQRNLIINKISLQR